MSLPVAILAGGLAMRLRPLSAQVPKSLVDVGGRPFIEWQLELLRDRGIDEVVLLTGHLGHRIREAVGNGARWGVRVAYAFDGHVPLGTGGAIRTALPRLGDAFFVLYGDSYLECDYASLEPALAGSGKSALMTVSHNDGRWDASNVLFSGGRILAYDKAAPSPQMRHIDYGLGVFRASAFEAWASGARFDLAAVYQRLLAAGDLAALEVAGRVSEIGSPAGLEETRTYLSAKGLVSR